MLWTVRLINARLSPKLLILLRSNVWIVLVSRARLLPFLRSDGGDGVWSIELTFLSQLRNLAAGVGMKIIPHVNCEYCYSEIANEQMIHDFTKNLRLL